MEQSQYLKNLLKRLNEASDQLDYKNQGQNTHTISTIKFERDEFDSNANYSKRQNMQTDDLIKYPYHNHTLKQEPYPHHNILQQISMVDNTKTSRNPILKFNPSKSRKKSEHSNYRQLQSKRQSTSRKNTKDLIEVRDKLNDIISFLNTKIESNPQVPQIKKVVNIEDIKQSITPQQSNIKQHKSLDNVNKSNEVLYLPRYQLNDAKLDKSIIENTNNPSNENNLNKQYINLKHSFDRLNDINSSNSMKQVQQSRFFTNYAQPSFQRNHAHINPSQNSQKLRDFGQIYPQSSFNYQNNAFHNIQQKPVILINGKKLNGSVLHNNNSIFPQPKYFRPLSQTPVLRYVNHSPNFYIPSNNNFSRNTIINQPIYPPPQPPQATIKQILSKHPNPTNLGPPSFRRIVASRPVSTQRSNTEPINNFKRQQIFLPMHIPRQMIKRQEPKVQIQKSYIPINNQQALQKSRLKKTSIKNYYKQHDTSQLNNPNNQTSNNQKSVLKIQDSLEQVLPQPKPYKIISNNIENPFKRPQLSISKKSQKPKAENNNQILQSIAEQSEQNHLTRNMQGSAKSSERMMSSVNSNLYLSKVNKFESGGSTKLKRKGIDVSSKQIYMSQYNRRS